MFANAPMFFKKILAPKKRMADLNNDGRRSPLRRRNGRNADDVLRVCGGSEETGRRQCSATVPDGHYPPPHIWAVTHKNFPAESTAHTQHTQTQVATHNHTHTQTQKHTQLLTHKNCAKKLRKYFIQNKKKTNSQKFTKNTEKSRGKYKCTHHCRWKKNDALRTPVNDWGRRSLPCTDSGRGEGGALGVDGQTLAREADVPPNLRRPHGHLRAYQLGQTFMCIPKKPHM